MDKKISEMFDYGDEIAVTDEINTMFDPAEIKEITMKKVHENSAHPRRHFRRITAVALAACLVLALGVTAYATGFAQSIISQIPTRFATPDAERDALLEKAGELSNKEPETVELTELMGNAITLDESYYDGENLMLVYTLDSLKIPVEFGYGPGDEHFDDLWTAGEGYQLAFGEDEVSPEDFQKILEIQHGTEEAGFIHRHIGIGDHIKLADGTDLGPMNGMEKDGKVFLQNQNPLPEAARGLDELELTLYVKEFVMYYYTDGVQEYTYSPVVKGEPVTFTIASCG